MRLFALVVCAVDLLSFRHEGREAVDHVRVRLHIHLQQALTEGLSVVEAFAAAYRRCDAELARLEVNKSGTTAVSALIRVCVAKL